MSTMAASQTLLWLPTSPVSGLANGRTDHAFGELEMRDD